MIKKTAVMITSCLALAVSYPTLADEKSDQKAAIKAAQDDITNPDKIKELSKSDPHVKAVDKNVKEVAGSDENAKEMYSISAEILPILMEMNHDNPEKALESLASYSRNPGEFLKSLPANIRERIEKLSEKIEKHQVKNKP